MGCFGCFTLFSKGFVVLQGFVASLCFEILKSQQYLTTSRTNSNFLRDRRTRVASSPATTYSDKPSHQQFSSVLKMSLGVNKMVFIFPSGWHVLVWIHRPLASERTKPGERSKSRSSELPDFMTIQQLLSAPFSAALLVVFE